jgi:outer membrane protein assembly factor BamB
MLMRQKTLIIAIMSVLAVSSLSGAISTHTASAATPTSNAGANWAYVNGNMAATNWSNQTQLTAANAASMQVQWVVPFPNVDLTWKQAPGASWTVEPGSSAPPLIVNGIVYSVSDQGTVYALNAKDGSILWSSSVTLNYTAALTKVPIFETQIKSGALHACSTGAANRNTTCIFASSSPVMHRHGINDVNGVIHVTGFACTLFGFNATTGATAYQINNICVNVPGNPVGAYPATYTSDPPMIWNGPHGPILTYSMGAYTNSDGRSFQVGYDYNAVLAAGAKGQAFDGACASSEVSAVHTDNVNGKCAPETAGQGPLWQVFFNPPNAGDANWDNEQCNIGMVFDYPAWRANGSLGRTCASLPASVKTNDWGLPKGVDATVSTTWGQYVLDNKTGIVYMGTGEESPYPYYNTAIRPGLNLYGSAIMAVNMTSGTLLWWYQMDPHDVSDWDASWAPILGTAAGQPAVFKATKLGVLYAFNRLTGKPIWAFENPADVYGKCTATGTVAGMTTWANGNAINAVSSMSTAYGKGGDSSCMSLGSPLNANWLIHPYPTYPDVNGTYVALPAATGSLESDVTYDGHNIYGAWMNQPGNVVQMNYKTGTTTTVKAVNNPINVTLTAISADTGKLIWTHFYNNFLFRGGMTVTNGMIIMPGGDGNVHFLNTTTGNELATLHVGASLFVQPTLGLTSDGQLRMITIFGGGRWSAAGSLGGGAQVPGGIMAYALPLGPAPTPSTTTVTSTVPGSGSTTTATTTSVTTVTSSTGTTGIDPTTFYAVAGIAVIAVIATGVLAVTRRKPST